MAFKGDMTMTAQIGWYAVKAAYMIVASFVFSYIFWWTKGLVEKGCKGKKRKK